MRMKIDFLWASHFVWALHPIKWSRFKSGSDDNYYYYYFLSTKILSSIDFGVHLFVAPFHVHPSTPDVDLIQSTIGLQLHFL